MNAKPDDLILGEISAIGTNHARASVPQVNNIEEVVLEIDETSRLIPGEAVPIRLLSLDGGRGKGVIEEGRYSRHFFPGDTVEVTAKEPVQAGVCGASADSLGNIDRLFVVGTTPETHLRARIDLVRDGRAFARPVTVHSEGIQVGDVLPARTRAGDSVADLTLNGYSVVLGTDALISTDIRVEIESIDDEIRGSVVDPKQLPVEGNQIEAVTQSDSRLAVARPGGYDVETDRHLHTAQGVRVEITEVDQASKTVNGTIVDESALPTVGDTVTATAEGGSRLASAEAGFSIELDRHAHCTSEVQVELTSVGSTIEGQVVEAGSLPTEGDTIEVVVSQGKRWAECSSGGYAVTLESPALIDGRFSAVVEEVDGASNPQVEIVSYDGKLPDVGERFSGTAHPMSDTVELEDAAYDIAIPGEVGKYGRATGRITSVESRIEGEIDEIVKDRSVNVSGDEDPVGSKNHLIHDTSL